MKTTKKIFAAVLAVMMIALMIPFSASAATTLTVSCNPNADTTGDKADYVGVLMSTNSTSLHQLRLQKKTVLLVPVQ